MMRVALCLLICAFISLGAQDFHGVVRDSLANPITGATLTMVDSANHFAGMVRTNERGEFMLRVPLPGRYAISAVPTSA